MSDNDDDDLESFSSFGSSIFQDDEDLFVTQLPGQIDSSSAIEDEGNAIDVDSSLDAPLKKTKKKQKGEKKSKKSKKDKKTKGDNKIKKDKKKTKDKDKGGDNKDKDASHKKSSKKSSKKDKSGDRREKSSIVDNFMLSDDYDNLDGVDHDDNGGTMIRDDYVGPSGDGDGNGDYNDIDGGNYADSGYNYLSDNYIDDDREIVQGSYDSEQVRHFDHDDDYDANHASDDFYDDYGSRYDDLHDDEAVDDDDRNAQSAQSSSSLLGRKTVRFNEPTTSLNVMDNSPSTSGQSSVKMNAFNPYGVPTQSVDNTANNHNDTKNSNDALSITPSASASDSAGTVSTSTIVESDKENPVPPLPAAVRTSMFRLPISFNNFSNRLKTKIFFNKVAVIPEQKPNIEAGNAVSTPLAETVSSVGSPTITEAMKTPVTSPSIGNSVDVPSTLSSPVESVVSPSGVLGYDLKTTDKDDYDSTNRTKNNLSSSLGIEDTGTSKWTNESKNIKSKPNIDIVDNNFDTVTPLSDNTDLYPTQNDPSVPSSSRSSRASLSPKQHMPSTSSLQPSSSTTSSQATTPTNRLDRTSSSKIFALSDITNNKIHPVPEVVPTNSAIESEYRISSLSVVTHYGGNENSVLPTLQINQSIEHNSNDDIISHNLLSIDTNQNNNSAYHTRGTIASRSTNATATAPIVDLKNRSSSTPIGGTGYDNDGASNNSDDSDSPSLATRSSHDGNGGKDTSDQVRPPVVATAMPNVHRHPKSNENQDVSSTPNNNNAVTATTSSNPVPSIAFCPDIKTTTFLNAIKFAQGKLPKVLCASADSSIHVYSVSNGERYPSLEGHTDRVVSLAVSNPFFSPDPTDPRVSIMRTLVVSGSRDEYLRIWDLDSAKCLHSIHAHKSTIWSVGIVVRANGQVIVVSTSADGTMRTWNGKTGEKLMNFKGHTDKILAVFILNPLSECPLLLSGGADKKVRVWELLTGAHIRMMEGHDDEITSIVAGSFAGISSLVISSVSGSGGVAPKDSKVTVVVSGSRDLTLRVWDFETGHLIYELLGHTGCVYQVALVRCTALPSEMLTSSSSSGNRRMSSISKVALGTPIIVSCSEDATVRLWDVTNGKQIRKLKWHKVSVRGVDVMTINTQPTCDDPNHHHNHHHHHGLSLIATCGWDKSIQIHELNDSINSKDDSYCGIS